MNSGDGCLILIVIVIVGVLVVMINNQQQLAKQREQARQAYQMALADLKADPTNPDLKEKTLGLGRHYSNLTRNKQGVTLFDEMALMNDMNAATARAPISQPPAADPSTLAAPISASIEERLAKLADLKSKGMLSDSEYETKRQKILDEI